MYVGKIVEHVHGVLCSINIYVKKLEAQLKEIELLTLYEEFCVVILLYFNHESKIILGSRN